MSEAPTIPGQSIIAGARPSRPVNYSLRPAKNIERKMMGEAFGRLAPLSPLGDYRYVGLGSEFFNDFSLYHQTLGIREMISIECDATRIGRCEFNRPYRCIAVRQGTASEVLPQLPWSGKTIVWLDYTDKLDRMVLADTQFLVSQACSGSMLVWTVNAEPWGGDRDEGTREPIKQSEWPERRLAKLKVLVGAERVKSELTGAQLAWWGLAGAFYEILVDEIRRTLNDRNSAMPESEKLSFLQCFHFRYADGQRMLTVGGLLLSPDDRAKLGASPFAGLWFVRDGNEATEIRPPTLTGREVRHLNKLLPHGNAKVAHPDWLSPEDLANYREIYRYYPVFAESEL